MSHVQLNDSEWKLISDLLLDRFGWSYEGVRRSLLEKQLEPRLEPLQLETFSEYYHYLLLHPGGRNELDELSSLLTNNETYFFRERHQFRILIDHLIPLIIPSLDGRPIRILSAGCSSGEEPYSIVMELQTAGVDLRGYRWHIDACDLNEKRIRAAKHGVYGDSSLRRCDEPVVRKHFQVSSDGYRLKDRHRLGVRFFTLNLVGDTSRLESSAYDAIFCRNVLIYFGQKAFLKTIDLFSRLLRRGGHLLLGHSESLISVRKDFAPVVFDEGIVYQLRGNEP